jgi:hypothetical protein
VRPTAPSPATDLARILDAPNSSPRQQLHLPAVPFQIQVLWRKNQQQNVQIQQNIKFHTLYIQT